MKINVYYGGRGLLDDPTLYVLKKMEDVLRELRVNIERFNIYEHKNEIATLPLTFKEADGIILATTIEWLGIGGYMQQFLDACWLYGDKEKIKSLYMMPVVLSTTYGEKEAQFTMVKAWEMLGGIPCNGICAYVNDTATFETSTEYSYLIEKSIENFYRVFSKKMSSLPSSSMAVRENVMQPKAIRLTPQESEQLSEFVSDESYVRQQKEDIQELSQMFKAMLGDDAGQKEEEPYIQEFKEAFQPIPNVALSFQWELTDIQKKLVFEIDNGVLNCYYGEKEDADVEIRSTKQILEKVIHGEAPLQTAFMGGELTAKGNFRVLHTFDSLFRFR